AFTPTVALRNLTGGVVEPRVTPSYSGDLGEEPETGSRSTASAQSGVSRPPATRENGVAPWVASRAGAGPLACCHLRGGPRDVRGVCGRPPGSTGRAGLMAGLGRDYERIRGTACSTPCR